MRAKLIISGLAFLAITAVAGAQQNRMPQSQRRCTAKGIGYVDANKNGICDNYEKSASSASPCQKPGPGKCCGTGNGQRGMGRGQGRRLNFTDANKDNICDHFEAAKK